MLLYNIDICGYYVHRINVVYLIYVMYYIPVISKIKCTDGDDNRVFIHPQPRS